MLRRGTGTLGVLGCGDDTTNPAGSGGTAGSGGMGGGGTAGSGGMGGGDGGAGGAPDPSEICNESACRTDGEKKAECEAGITACIADEPEVNWDECFIGVVTIACSAG